MKRERIVLCLFLMLGAMLAWLLWANKALVITRMEVTDSRIPEIFSGYSIAQVSDLHNAEFGAENQKLLRMLAEEEPNIIVLTGDLIDSNHTDVEIALDFASQAVKIAPTYYATGNHEARTSRYKQLKEGLEALGVVVLENEGVILEKDGEQIVLYGLQDPGFAVSRGEYPDALSAVEAGLEQMPQDNGLYTMLLAHRPEFFEQYAGSDADLVFSGHAHGGQVRLPFVGGLIAPGQGLFPKYDAGLYELDDTCMVVSRGLGNSVVPLRVNNRPEILLVCLNSER